MNETVTGFRSAAAPVNTILQVSGVAEPDKNTPHSTSGETSSHTQTASAAHNTADSTAAHAASDNTAQTRPRVKPADPRFSSGPCRKHPGWSLNTLNTDYLGRSHRAKEPKARLASAIERSAKLLGLPADWKLGIMPGSDTGAVEAALWSLLGQRPVDVLVWESFSSDWATDIKQLAECETITVNLHKADYGDLPDLSRYNPAHDTVFAFNGTTSGVRVPDLDWIHTEREGLVICDATSAAYAQPLNFEKLDVVTWSWQKVLGGEAAHGMLALSPRAVAQLENRPAPRALPKVFTLTKKGLLNAGIFNGATINTPSMLCVEDLHSALDWAESLGGHAALEALANDNLNVINDWITDTEWVEWLPVDPTTRSNTSLCIKIVDPVFAALPEDTQQGWIKTMCQWLAEEHVAFDIAHYRTAPAGFRLWGGPTVATQDLIDLTPWLDWAFKRCLKDISLNGENA